MKQGKRPTLRQKKLLKYYGFNPEKWLIVKNLPQMLVIVHRETGRAKNIEL